MWAEMTGWRSYCRTVQEAAVALIAVAAGAVCVPLNPGFTAEEWRRYFDDLRVSALLTRADMDFGEPRGCPYPRHTRHRPVAPARQRTGRVRSCRPGNEADRRWRVSIQYRRRVYPADLGRLVAPEDGPTDPRRHLSVRL